MAQPYRFRQAFGRVRSLFRGAREATFPRSFSFGFNFNGDHMLFNGDSMTFNSEEDPVGEILWTPDQLSTLVWFDPSNSDTVTASAGLVSQVDDLSGNENNAVQSSAAAQPTTDGEKLYFDGSNIMLIENDPFNGLQNFVVVAVTARTAGGWGNRWANSVISWNGESGNGWQIRQFDNLTETYSFAIRGTNGTENGDIVVDSIESPHIISGYRRNSDTRVFRVKGEELLNISDTGTVNYDAGLSGIGGRYRGVLESSDEAFFNGEISEILVMNYTTEDDITKAEGYLAHKWNLAADLPATHPYKNNAPTI